MTATLDKCDITMLLDALTTATIGGLGAGSEQIGYPNTFDLHGLTSGAITKLQFTATTTPATIVLRGSSGVTDAFGAALNFNPLHALIVFNRSTTTGQTLNIAGNFIGTKVLNTTATIKIGPGGAIWLLNPTDGYTVTAATADTISFVASTGTILTDLFIIGSNV